MNGHRGSGLSTSTAVLLRQHRRGYSIGSNVALEEDKDDDLALFHEMRRREREKERKNMLLLPNNAYEELDIRLNSSAGGSSPGLKVTPSTPVAVPRRRSDDLLNGDGEGDKNDYDWLLTPPDTPLFTSLEMETPADQRVRAPAIRPPSPAVKTNKLFSSETETSGKSLRNGLASRQVSVSNNSSNGSSKRLTPSTGSRPSTPTSRPTLPSARSTATTTKSVPLQSRPVASAPRPATSASRPAAGASRPSTPTARHTLPTSKITSTLPTSKSTSTVPASRPTSSASRPSTPTTRPSVPSSRPASRPATPTRRPNASNPTPSTSVPRGRSSSVGKTPPMASRNTNSLASRGCSPTVKTRPWQPSEMPGFSLDAPPNLRTTMPERPSSATRGRPGAPTGQSSSREEANMSARSRRSCSPSVTRGRMLNDIHSNDRSSTHSTKSRGNGNDMTAIVGSKMVEKMMYARRAASKLQDDQMSTKSAPPLTQVKRPVKSTSSPDSGGFGRSLSKKSLDMAIRHMDTRRSAPKSLRPLGNNISAPSLYGARSASMRRRPNSISDSPIATSSNASSDYSMNNVLGPEGSELEDEDFGSERGSKASPASQQGSACSKGDAGSAHWLHSLEFKDNKLDHSFLYKQESESKLESLENFVGSGDKKATDKPPLDY